MSDCVAVHSRYCAASWSGLRKALEALRSRLLMLRPCRCLLKCTRSVAVQMQACLQSSIPHGMVFSFCYSVICHQLSQQDTFCADRDCFSTTMHQILNEYCP